MLWYAPLRWKRLKNWKREFLLNSKKRKKKLKKINKNEKRFFYFKNRSCLSLRFATFVFAIAQPQKLVFILKN